jgi:hypothetical protein
MLNLDIDENFKMKAFPYDRKCYPRRNYEVKEYLIQIKHIKTKKDIKIIRLMRKWNTTKNINLLQVLKSNIHNPVISELLFKNLSAFEYVDQFQAFLQPLDIDELPCKPSHWIENPKDRSLRLPKVHQISFSCKWTKNPNKILTPATLQIFFNNNNTCKQINEVYQKDWEFEDLYAKTRDHYGPSDKQLCQ